MIRWEGGGLHGVPLLRSVWVAPPQGWHTPSTVRRHNSHGLEPGPPGLDQPGGPQTQWDHCLCLLNPRAPDGSSSFSHLGSK